MNFDSVLYSGIEWELYIWNIFIYQMWMLTLDSCAIALFLTFICDKIVNSIRSFFAEKNLSKKAIIDNKFFMTNINY
jgi:succinate-acetate transporter protein